MHRKGGGVFNSGFVSTNPETRCRSPNRLEVRIAEGDSVNVTAAVFTETADETDVGFAAGIGEAHGEDFAWSEFIARANAGAVEAEDEGCAFPRRRRGRKCPCREGRWELVLKCDRFCAHPP